MYLTRDESMQAPLQFSERRDYHVLKQPQGMFWYKVPYI